MTSDLRKLPNSTKHIQPENVQNEYQDESRSPTFCELRYRDRCSTEIAISGDSYAEYSWGGS
eukprot:6214611-Pleurochrysis_carterae.AAC.4